MALVHIDSACFDNRKRWPTTGSYWPFQSTTASSRGGYAYYLTGVDTLYARLKTTEFWVPSVNPQSLYVGFRGKITLVANTWITFFEFRESSSNQIYFQAYSNGALRAVQGNAVVLGMSNANTVNTAVYSYLEFGVNISKTTGSVVIRSDNIEQLNIVNTNTQFTANSLIDQLGWGTFTIFNGSALYWHDTYVDTTNFHGDVIIHGVVPTSDGDTNFIPSTGTNHYPLVDEFGNVITTDYTQSSNVGNRDSYGFVCPTINGVIQAVAYFGAIANPDAANGNKITKTFCKVGSTYYNDSNINVSNVLSAYQSNIRLIDPSDSANWTASKINATYFGLEITG